MSPGKTASIALEIKQAETALKADMADYFLNRFQGLDKIRVLHDFQAQAAVVDIETTGLNPNDVITSIAMLNNGKISLFVNGINLPDFLSALSTVKLLITFNGARFDLPFLRRHFLIDLGIPHLDLMPVLKQLGYSGGQKQCEKKAKLQRCHSDGMSGKDAVFLWNRWETQNHRESLNELMIYNAEDVFMLEKLAVKAYNLVMKTFPMHLSLESSTIDKVLTTDNIMNSVL